MTPSWFIASTYAGFSSALAAGLIDYDTYVYSLAVADDVFYGCLVERFANQGGMSAPTRINVGEPNQPINGCGFIRDDRGESGYLYQKLLTPVF